VNRGDVLDLGSLGKAAGKAAEEGDIDKVLALLDKADKLLNNPLIQGFLGTKQPVPPYQNAQPVTAPAIIEKVPDGAIVPASEVHAKIMKMMNRMDPAQLMGLLSHYGGETVVEAVSPKVKGGENATQAIEKES
jgi:hypothetical protein